MTTLRSYFSPWLERYNKSWFPFITHHFISENHQTNLWELPYFCIGCLLKSGTVTSFSQLHLSPNSGTGRSLDRINLHFLALHTRWLIKKAKKIWKTFEIFCRNGKFHAKREAYRRKIDGKIVLFLSSVFYYFGDLLKSANMAFVRHKTFISL